MNVFDLAKTFIRFRDSLGKPGQPPGRELFDEIAATSANCKVGRSVFHDLLEYTYRLGHERSDLQSLAYHRLCLMADAIVPPHEQGFNAAMENRPREWCPFVSNPLDPGDNAEINRAIWLEAYDWYRSWQFSPCER